jgi:hypothetical protein
MRGCPVGTSVDRKKCNTGACEWWIDEVSMCSITIIGRILLDVISAKEAGGGSGGERRGSTEGPTVYDVQVDE